MAGWPKGLTREAAKLLSPEEKRALWNKPKEATPPEPPRPRLEARAKPAKKSWTLKAGNNWETASQIEENPDEFYIPRDMFPEGLDLQWWTREIFGQETKQRVSTARRGGWTELHDSDCDNWHSRVLGSKYALDENGYIVHKGLGLFARPQEVSDRSRARDFQKAKEAIALKEQAFKGGEMRATGADHPSALATNRISRTIERIDVPKDE